MLLQGGVMGECRYLVLLFLLLVKPLQASDETLLKAKPHEADINDSKPKIEADLIDGLILNRTMTRFGHRFYKEFVMDYRNIGGMTDHDGLTIKEQASARNGSRMTILHNRKPVFVTVVSPASRNIDAQAKSAASYVDKVLRQQRDQAAWSSLMDPDLAADEF
ncbi:curli production assembly/transport protein CsgE [Shewanella submarina]|uniref:Curli production assembly/transport component CsgE n=1 Tax=Shewanella submarina TaxID=2016376 RepID=A0ABV7G9S4_9GAMM|nr:curli production assembly/transport protein CsgE [Shewanella submarina]MCL1039299.1 curli production assembly/transport protein CsgE [Shewanella submarina]